MGAAVAISCQVREERHGKHRRTRLAATTAVALAWSPAPRRRRNSRRAPITIIVGIAPGGIADVTTRIYADAMSKSLGQKIVVENRPVGGGTVAAVAVQNAAPDGYTLLTITGSAHAAIPAMQPVGLRSGEGLYAGDAAVPDAGAAGGAPSTAR